jgi:V/A-type H+-transporting ATPase subunit D
MGKNILQIIGRMKMVSKKNLILAKQGLTLSQKAHDLLEIKLGALFHELKRVEKIVRGLHGELQKILSAAERARLAAEMEIGEKVAEIWENTQWESINPPYKLKETCVALDEAFFAWQQVFLLKKKLAEAEEKIANLKIRANRTKKRAAALRNIKIPEYKRRVKYIADRLEEHERDEMVRLKVARKADI